MWLVNGIQYNYTPLMDLRYAMGERSHSLQRLASVGSWGTQVELQAAFNVTVFVCSSNISQIIRWEIKGTPKHHSIHIPPVSLHTTLPFTHSAHIELCYNKYHYTSQLRKECSSHHSKAQQQRCHRLIGRAKRAHLVVQLARFFYIYVSSLRPCRRIPYRF